MFPGDLNQPCPVPKGTRIRLLAMPDDPNPIERGEEGVVTGGNGAQIFVDWDSGRSLILLPTIDQYEIVY